jgi:hypothetical protein
MIFQAKWSDTMISPNAGNSKSESVLCKSDGLIGMKTVKK